MEHGNMAAMLTQSDTADASDHEGAANAIAKGLASGHSKENPGFWLHTGGAGILCWETMRDDNKLGEWSEREYNDWKAVQDLVDLPKDAFHKNVDEVVLKSGNEAVKTAILCPPTIYGNNHAPVYAYVWKESKLMPDTDID
jgi:hypothetical protein